MTFIGPLALGYDPQNRHPHGCHTGPSRNTSRVDPAGRARAVDRQVPPGAFVGNYTALSQKDAQDFASNVERQNDHRTFAVQKGRAAR